jgi:hypothetical protein
LSLNDHEPVAPEIADNKTLAGGLFLAAYYGLCIHAIAGGQPMPEPGDASDALKGEDISGLIESTRSVMDRPSKPAMARFMAGWADLLAEHGAELQQLLSQWTRPEQERQVVIMMSESDATRLASALGLEL